MTKSTIYDRLSALFSEVHDITAESVDLSHPSPRVSDQQLVLGMLALPDTVLLMLDTPKLDTCPIRQEIEPTSMRGPWGYVDIARIPRTLAERLVDSGYFRGKEGFGRYRLRASVRRYCRQYNYDVLASIRLQDHPDG